MVFTNNNANNNSNTTHQQSNDNSNLNAKLANMLKQSMTSANKAKLPKSNSLMNQVNGCTANSQLEETTSMPFISASASSTNGGVSSAKLLSSEDKKINLNALKNQDPFATNIIDTALRVAVYKFVAKKNEWVRDIKINAEQFRK